MYKAHLTLGVMPTKRGMLSLEAAKEQKDRFMPVIREIRPDIVEIVDIDDLCPEGILADETFSPAVTKKFYEAKVDAIFVPFCDFGEEGAVADVVAHFDVPILIWGARDERPNTATSRGRDTQCGMFAATKVIRRYGKKYSYIYNVPADTDEFRNGFLKFLRVANVMKDLKTLRIAKIGERPAPFRSVMTNEAALMKRFGIQVIAVPPIQLQAAMNKILEEKGPRFVETKTDIVNRMDVSMAAPEMVDHLAALKIAVADTLEEKGCSVGAIECWPTGFMLGFPACAMIGEVTDLGYPIACETDINGAITMAILRGAMFGDQAEFLADLTIRNPENDQSELLWHCGPFAWSLKRKDCPMTMDGRQGHFLLKEGALTLCRFDEAEGEYYLFAGEAHTTTGPETTGTYTWIEVDDWKKWEEKFMFGPYIHHLGGAYEDLFAVLREVARYLDVHFDTSDTPGPVSL